MEAAFAAAASRKGVDVRAFRIANLTVNVSFAGPALLAAIEPALAHLATPSAPAPDLSVRVWDTASTGIAVPMPSRRGLAASTALGARPERVRSSYQAAPRILTLYDPDRRRAVVWVPDAGAVPSNEVASPMRTLLHWWARDNGLQLVHAGAVGLDGRAVLLCGPAGAGKSTSVLAGMLSGLDYLGDDYVLVDARRGTKVHSLYSAAKLQPEHVSAFPELRPTLVNGDRLGTEKALWFIHRDFPERTQTSAEALAVLVPRVVSGSQSAVVPIRRSTALSALAPSTIVQLSGADQWSLRAMAAFIERVATYELRAGSDLTGVARAIRFVLDGAAP
jgi:hypothetical protein